MFAFTAAITHRRRRDWAVAAAVLLMLAMNVVALYGLGPGTAYAAVPM